MNPQEIHQIYNDLEVKDMSRHEFIKKVQDLTSQTGVQKDLGNILGMKQTVAVQKQKIDRAIKNG